VGLIALAAQPRRWSSGAAGPKIALPRCEAQASRAGYAFSWGNSMSQFLVRPSTDHDLSDIARIYCHHVLHGSATFELDPPSRDEMAERRSAILALGLPYMVAEEHGVVAGYAYAGAYRPRPAYRFTVEDSVYVDPQHVGRGCGRVLLAAAIAHCEQGPWRQMVAVIGDSGNAASIALHRHFGFRSVGTLSAVGFKFDQSVDTVLMQRELGQGVV
jgi:L-amino acid N-acyltransferase YncA